MTSLITVNKGIFEFIAPNWIDSDEIQSLNNKLAHFLPTISPGLLASVAGIGPRFNDYRIVFVKQVQRTSATSRLKPSH